MGTVRRHPLIVYVLVAVLGALVLLAQTPARIGPPQVLATAPVAGETCTATKLTYQVAGGESTQGEHWCCPTGVWQKCNPPNTPAAAAGSHKQVQINNLGSFGGAVDLLFDPVTGTTEADRLRTKRRPWQVDHIDWNCQPDVAGDDSACLQAVIDDCASSGGGLVVFPEGQFHANLRYKDGCSLWCSENNGTEIVSQSNSTPVLDVYAETGVITRGEIKNCKFTGHASGTGDQHGIQLRTAGRCSTATSTVCYATGECAGGVRGGDHCYSSTDCPGSTCTEDGSCPGGQTCDVLNTVGSGNRSIDFFKLDSVFVGDMGGDGLRVVGKNGPLNFVQNLWIENSTISQSHGTNVRLQGKVIESRIVKSQFPGGSDDLTTSACAGLTGVSGRCLDAAALVLEKDPTGAGGNTGTRRTMIVNSIFTGRQTSGAPDGPLIYIEQANDVVFQNNDFEGGNNFIKLGVFDTAETANEAIAILNNRFGAYGTGVCGSAAECGPGDPDYVVSIGYVSGFSFQGNRIEPDNNARYKILFDGTTRPQQEKFVEIYRDNDYGDLTSGMCDADGNAATFDWVACSDNTPCNGGAGTCQLEDVAITDRALYGIDSIFTGSVTEGIELYRSGGTFELIISGDSDVRTIYDQDGGTELLEDQQIIILRQGSGHSGIIVQDDSVGGGNICLEDNLDYAFADDRDRLALQWHRDDGCWATLYSSKLSDRIVGLDPSGTFGLRLQDSSTSASPGFDFCDADTNDCFRWRKSGDQMELRGVLGSHVPFQVNPTTASGNWTVTDAAGTETWCVTVDNVVDSSMCYNGTSQQWEFDKPIAGSIATATALAANGANCSSTQAAIGVDASGAAEGCFTPATACGAANLVQYSGGSGVYACEAPFSYNPTLDTLTAGLYVVGDGTNANRCVTFDVHASADLTMCYLSSGASTVIDPGNRVGTDMIIRAGRGSGFQVTDRDGTDTLLTIVENTGATTLNGTFTVIGALTATVGFSSVGGNHQYGDLSTFDVAFQKGPGPSSDDMLLDHDTTNYRLRAESTDPLLLSFVKVATDGYYSADWSKGANCADTASAATISVNDCESVTLTGTTAVDTINTCDSTNRNRELTVFCGSDLSVINDGDGSGDNILLTAIFICTAGDTLTLKCDGTNWRETSRAVN